MGAKEKTADQIRTSSGSDLTRTRNHLDGFLLVNRQTIAFNRESVYWLDVEAFEGYLEGQPSGNPEEPVLRLDKERVERLKRAVALYRGQFLEKLLALGASLFPGVDASARWRD